MVYPISQSSIGELKNLSWKCGKLSKGNKSFDQEELCLDVKAGCFVGCVYEEKLWFGQVKNFDEEYGDYNIKFLHPSGIATSYTFPTKEDACQVPTENIIGVLPAALKGGTRIQYTFQDIDMNNISKGHMQWLS